MIALSVAGVLAVFLLYTSIAGGGNPSLAPSELAGRTGEVQLAGSSSGRFGVTRTRRPALPAEGHRGDSTTSVAVLYSGSVPDLFKVGRQIVVDGRLRKGTFVARAGLDDHEVPVEVRAEESGDPA